MKSYITIKKLFLILFSLPFSIMVMNAQVTIGSDKKPNLGAILDLKQIDTIGVNSNKGLLLPRVELINKNKLIPMLPSGYDVNTEHKNHAGLLVYNTNQCMTEQGDGIYVWDGEEWTYLGSKSNGVLSYTDQEGNPFLARRFGEAGIWMTQNLGAKTYDSVRDSDNKTVVPITTSNIRNPNNDPNLVNKYPWMGMLYNRDVATNSYITNGEGLVQGICPSGWHVPSYQEWMLLENELVKNTKAYTSSQKNYIDEGIKLQTKPQNGNYRGTQNGNIPYGEKNTKKLMTALLGKCPVEGKLDVVTSGVSSHLTRGGMDIRLVGGMVTTTKIDGYGEKTGFWMSDKEATGVHGQIKVIIVKDTTPNKVSIHNNAGEKERAYSIRCKKNTDTP